ncbi:trypsin-like serine protease [Micromonospora azadirachtae]|uniref:Trypsin-like serine protease n=1 Tax=Micromonospora azadirachtae TaxID=1970735 RepID=A0ABW2ZXB2_9ACTN
MAELSARRRWSAGIMVGLALVAAAAVAPTTAAQAAPAPSGHGVSNDGRSRLPNLYKGKLVLPEPGAKGRPFQSGTSAAPKIFQGTLASASEFPYIVGIVTTYKEGGGSYFYFCTGTIIAPNKVLTAAHCTADGPGTTRVIAGNDRLVDDNGNIITTSGYVAEVASTWTHPSWNIAQQIDDPENAPIVDDVSVLTLKQNLPSVYTPVSLSEQGDQTPYAAGTSAVIAGYGVTSDDEVWPDTRLRKATVNMRSNDECNLVPELYYPERMICAGNATPDTPGSDTCPGDSGGPLLVGGVQVGITDWGFIPCGTFPGYYERLSYYADAVNADIPRPAAPNLDWTGDGHADLIARDSSGRLRLYTGTGFANDGSGGFWSSEVINSGWGSMKRIFRVYNWNGDHKPSIMAVNSSGELWLYNGDGQGGFAGAARRIGTGWGGFTALVPTSNWLGNGKPGLIARNSAGELIRYDGNGAGGWASATGTRIGTGWNGFNAFMTPGSWFGTGNEALIVRKTTTGELFVYQSDSAGGWATTAGIKINSGWGSFLAIPTPGDWSGDNAMDLLGVDSAGKLRIYPTDGKGNWLPGGAAVINSGWNTVSPIF